MAGQDADRLEVDLSESINRDIFSSYICRSAASIGLPHPAPVAESTSLASVSLPKTDYPLLDALPRDLVSSGKLSQLQLEGILYACAKHQELLPSGERAGFMIGDGAGVGKGRQIGGVIIDNYARGRKRHLWVSISSDLHLDAMRDLRDLGCYINVINGCQQLDRETKALGLSKDFQEGVLFLTYSTLISSVKGRSRLQQVVDWLGGDAFDGVICLDECHKAKNFAPGKESQSTKVATAVLELQQRLPMARVLYCSATGISEVGNMAYLQRLGLWGPGTSFRDFESFLDAMKRRGVSFMELLAMELKAEGKFVARGLSFKDAEFSELEARLTPAQTDVYNAAVNIWQALRVALESALQLTAAPSRDVMRTFWSNQQRFFKLLCVSMKVPSVVSEARAALSSGSCVVIGLQTTGEAAADSLGLEPGPVPGFVSTCKEILLRSLYTHFPVNRQDPGGGEPEEVRECVEMRAELQAAIEDIQLPANYLDEIIDQLGGPGQVAEMTGRSGRVVRDASGGFVYEVRARGETQELESLNVREKDLFNSGQRLVAIISDAASTGISLHASKDFKNRRRRVHLTIELPWSADKAIQQLGRSHRSNQVSAPCYKLVSTSVGGERRFAAAVARRLQSLGALTRGDRRAASGLDLSEQNFDSPLGRKSLKRMYDAIVTSSPRLPPGVSLGALMAERIGGDMEASAAAALLSCDDPVTAAERTTALHTSLRGHCEVMAVGLALPRGDSVAEEAAGTTAGGAATGAVPKDSVGDVRRFLNRLLGLHVDQQAVLFNYFAACLAAEIRAAKAEGKYSEGLADLFGSRIALVSQEVMYEDPVTGLRTHANTFDIDRGLSFKDALVRLELAGGPVPEDGTGFWRSRRPLYGQPLVLLAVLKAGTRNTFTVSRPSTGDSAWDMERDELAAKYVPLGAEEAAPLWEAAYTVALTQCLHGAECKQGAGCTIGRRVTSTTVLSGSVVRLWGVLEAVMGRHEAGLSRADRNMRVVRVELPRAPTPAQPERGSVGVDDAGVGASGQSAGQEQQEQQQQQQYPADARSGSSPTVRGSAASAAPDYLVGVRYPAQLLPEVIATLHSLALQSTLQQHLTGAFAGALPRGARLAAPSSTVRTEAPTAVDKRVAAKMFRPPKTLHSFFRAAPAPGVQQGTDGAAAATGPRAAPAVALPAATAGPSRGGAAAHVDVVDLTLAPEQQQQGSEHADGMQPGGDDSGQQGHQPHPPQQQQQQQQQQAACTQAPANHAGVLRPAATNIQGDRGKRQRTSGGGSAITKPTQKSGSGTLVALMAAAASGGRQAGTAQAAPAGASSKARAEAVQALVAMGFGAAAAERALFLAAGNIDRAVELALGGM